MKKIIVLLVLVLSISTTIAADLETLTKLFQDNFDSFFTPRFCGRNTVRLINEAKKLGINLDNSYVLKFSGKGFLETSGFYTRQDPNDRVMLGYFHIVLVADGYVFDFDLSEPLVLKMNDYIRLQFTPPYLPFMVFGINYKPEVELKFWELTSFETSTYPTKETVVWKKKLHEVINLQNVMSKDRVR